MKQLTLEDVVGTFDYKAKSTAEQFLAKPQGIPTYAVDFFDKDLRQKLRWFEAKTKSEAEGMAKDTDKYRLLTYTFRTDHLKKSWS